jgi:NAD+ diphosphatase
MFLDQTVTFGGSGFDRRAEIRGDDAALTTLKQDPKARVLPVWRGKPLITGEEQDGCGWLGLDHPMVAFHGDAAVFLGVVDGGPRFACDMSTWEPESGEGPDGSVVDVVKTHHPLVPSDHLFADLRGVMTHLTAEDAEMAAISCAILAWHGSHGFCAKCGGKSHIAMAGWQRNCGDCNAPHFPRTDPVVIMLVTHGNDVLLGRNPAWPEGMYSLLAGFVEPGETIESTVRREVREEVGVATGRVQYLASQPWPFPMSLMFGCRAEALSREIKIDPTEIEEAFWMPREELLEAFEGRHPRMNPPRKGAIAHFILSNWLADTLK